MTLRRKFTGAKHDTEAAEFRNKLVGERSIHVEVRPEGLVESMEVRMPV